MRGETHLSIVAPRFPYYVSFQSMVSTRDKSSPIKDQGSKIKGQMVFENAFYESKNILENE